MLKLTGKIEFDIFLNQFFRFISAGPDQRRSESTGPDGITRGAFSYLDDKGMQSPLKLLYFIYSYELGGIN